MSCRRRRGYRRFSTSAYRLLGDFEVAITGGVWVATGAFNPKRLHFLVHLYVFIVKYYMSDCAPISITNIWNNQKKYKNY